jgi:uncharacterized lipoprotein YehR (DUF1307 family)
VKKFSDQLFVLTVIMLSLASCGSSGSKDQVNIESSKGVSTAATMYYGGDIITMEGDSAQYAEAVVVKNGKILFVGGKDEALRKGCT